jgi:hypothetical protein
MGIQRSLMRLMVWNMRWMTRRVGFIARPIVRAYAGLEVIACGLRESNARVAVIYTAAHGRTGHHVRVYDRRRWRPIDSTQAEDFSGPVVRRVLVPTAAIGERYRMCATTRLGRRVSSPTITVKEETVHDPAPLAVTLSSDGSVKFSWAATDVYDPMIYFLAVEDARGVNKAAVYTREVSWTYPRTEAASLSLGPSRPPRLPRGETHTAKLVAVDYQGWVSHLAEQSFTT